MLWEGASRRRQVRHVTTGSLHRGCIARQAPLVALPRNIIANGALCISPFRYPPGVAGVAAQVLPRSRLSSESLSYPHVGANQVSSACQGCSPTRTPTQSTRQTTALRPRAARPYEVPRSHRGLPFTCVRREVSPPPLLSRSRPAASPGIAHRNGPPASLTCTAAVLHRQSPPHLSRIRRSPLDSLRPGPADPPECPLGCRLDVRTRAASR